VAEPRSRLSEPGWVLLPLRLFLGAMFLYAGLSKFADPDYLDETSPRSISAQLSGLVSTSPLGPLLERLDGIAEPLGVLLALGEVAVGLGALVGLFTRVAAVGGALLSLSLLLTVSWQTRPIYLGNDLPYLAAWVPLILAGSGGVFSLDGVLARRAAAGAGGAQTAQAVGRRRVLAGAGAGGALAVLGLAAAGLASLVGSRRTPSRTAAAPGAASSPAPSATGPGAASSPAPSGTASPAPGAATRAPAPGVLAALDDIPVGGARDVVDPVTNGPACLVRTGERTVTGFSAICPHAGCPVGRQREQFICPCHESVFDGRTGARRSGPATRDLDRLPIAVRGDNVVRET